MECVPVNRLEMLPFYAGAVVFYGYRFSQGRGGVSTPVTVRLMVGALFILMAALSESLAPSPLWRHLSSLLLFHQGMLFTFLGVDYLLHSQRSQSILRHKWFLGITMLSLASVAIDGQRPHILGDVFRPGQSLQLIDYLAYLSNYGVQIMILGLTVAYYAINLSKHKDIVYIFRRTLCMIGFSITMLCILATRVNYVFFLAPSNEPWSSSFCQINVAISSIFLIVGFMVPHALLQKIATPISWLVRWRQDKINRLINDLHAMMLAIVPGVQLNNRSVRHLRAVIEINDARQTIWSYVEREQPITPKDDARFIVQLLTQQIILTEPGDHLPPPLQHRCSVRHNIATAKYLKRLLAQHPA